MKIGFIGQGWIGKSYADDFEKRGFLVVRYSLEEPYIHNRDALRGCEVVLICVPTPTVKDGVDLTVVRSTLLLLSKGTTVVIKSTIPPGTTETLQHEFPDLYVIHSPEFLQERTASFDAANPKRNIIGIPKISDEFEQRASRVLEILPHAPFNKIMFSRNAELVKYAGNCFLYMKVIFINMLYDLVTSTGCDWDVVREAFINDPRIGTSHTNPIHKSGHDEEVLAQKRGAGGHCFVKDFEAFRRLYDTYLNDKIGSDILKTIAYKNIQLLAESNKDIDILEDVYGNLNKMRTWKDPHDILLG